MKITTFKNSLLFEHFFKILEKNKNISLVLHTFDLLGGEKMSNLICEENPHLNMKYDTDDTESLDICPICREICSQPVPLLCRHLICYDCLFAYINSNKSSDTWKKCPMCSQYSISVIFNFWDISVSLFIKNKEKYLNQLVSKNVAYALEKKYTKELNIPIIKQKVYENCIKKLKHILRAALEKWKKKYILLDYKIALKEINKILEEKEINYKIDHYSLLRFLFLLLSQKEEDFVEKNKIYFLKRYILFEFNIISESCMKNTLQTNFKDNLEKGNELIQNLIILSDDKALKLFSWQNDFLKKVNSLFPIFLENDFETKLFKKINNSKIKMSFEDNLRLLFHNHLLEEE